MLRIGTRASALARWQAQWVADRLQDRGLAFELVPISTRGDADQQDSIARLSGSPGVFTKELQRALLDGRIDIAVHSLKDLPTDQVEGLVLAAVPPRESPFDVLISREGAQFANLAGGTVVGTGSMRRRAQLLHARPDLVITDIRGNVDTRIRKLREGAFDAIVLAEAGIHRLGLDDQITQVFGVELMVPAIGQGVLAVEARSGDESTLTALASLDDPHTRAAISAERAMLAALAGGCLAPIGGWARVVGSLLQLNAVALDSDGQHRLTAEASSPPVDAVALGHRAADQLLAAGAADLIAQARAT